MSSLKAISQHCKRLNLSTVARILPEALSLAEAQDWSSESLLAYLLEEEVNQRRVRRIERHLRQARLPLGKTLDAFNLEGPYLASNGSSASANKHYIEARPVACALEAYGSVGTTGTIKAVIFAM